MTTAFFFFFFFSLRDVSLGAPVDTEDIDQSMDYAEIILRPKADMETTVVHGDIAVPNSFGRNADPCTARGCKWPKTGRYVNVPYYIAPDYTPTEMNIIIRGMQSISQSTCIRFVPVDNRHRDYIYFISSPGAGCLSYLGRQKGGQYISLEKNGCLYHSTVQHEILHALGFHHEQVRSDRDRYVRILTENIQKGREGNFRKVPTNNLGTPYDFNSVMHYRKYDFSSNGLPTIVAKSNYYLDFGNARQMSPNDIARINRLYRC
ncbi:low choriolytic enzyme-like [Leuresthes tenuis]|uniref:low choriolytic enzyme-like n=1 Tax=Leuresthes tenuis TaxID=355514 RepID=UPI003B4FFC34